MSISNLYPSIAPSLSLDFSNVGALDPRITFVRTTTATYYGTDSAKAEENLLLQSQDFTTSWGVTNATATANTEVAPDGTTTAETITDNVTNGVHIVQQSVSLIVNIPFTFSCFLKEGTNTHAYLSIRDTGTAQRYFAADFNLDTGTVRTTDAGTSGTLTSSSITSVGNDWYRCVIIGQVAAATSMFATVGVSDGSSSFSTFGSIAYAGTSTTIFAWGAQLEQRSAVTAYTPTTTQPITNYIPVLEVAAAGEARFDHNPTTFESLGLLVEEQRTNLVTYSEEFDNAAWTKTASSITANTIVAPSGELTGDKLIENTANAQHTCTTSVVATIGQVETFSVYAKAGERTRLDLAGAGFAAQGFFATFDLLAGTVVVNTGSKGSIQSVGNGWYRCSISFTPSVASGYQIQLNNGSTTIYTGNGFNGIFIWGAQLEAGAFPTSYIQTVAATVTRNADVASMTGTNFSSWYRQDEGTLYAEATLQKVAGNPSAFVSIDNNTASSRIQLRRTSTGISANFRFASSGGNVDVSNTLGTDAAGNKMAAAFASNDQMAVNNGTLFTGITSVPQMPIVTQLSIGGGPQSAFLNGTIKKIAFYPSRLSNAQLQALTTL